MRLDKFLGEKNIGSRKQIKEYVKNGRATINGVVAKSCDIHIDENKDEIAFDGEILTYSEYSYFMLNKPGGVVSSTREGKTTTVVDLLKKEGIKNLFPVGRLDKDTVGLLLLTNNGLLAHNLLSPKKHVDKEYEVHLLHDITDSELEILERGVDIGDGDKTLPAKAFRAESRDGHQVIHLIIHEGRFHQVKRMLESVGNEVVFLKRLSMGTLQLDPELSEGEYRELTDEEINCLLDNKLSKKQ
ncbi:MAG: rRNA pseudouridine synthase [Butyrivibrio sp.]|nr:rRNA pseudouridine synthase [Butyrivibrio sp.]